MTKRPRPSLILGLPLACAAFLLAACSSGGGDGVPHKGPFDHSLTNDVEFGVRVTLDGAACAFARVQVTSLGRTKPGDNGPAPGPPDALYLSGLTDEDGFLHAAMRLPEVVREVAVVVHVPGASGAYTDPALAAAWGPFAPSSRIHSPVTSLSQVELALSTD